MSPKPSPIARCTPLVLLLLWTVLSSLQVAAGEPRTRHLDADGNPRYTNRLANETSPYLRQHAHNPVDWYPWGEAAFARARAEQRPVFLSIGYSTCHWCHVMERESFDDEVIARLLNDHFIAIKVDREERPEVDATYLAATELMAGRGGWPLTLLLTPDGAPFFGETYLPPAQFRTLLERVATLWRDDRTALLGQGERLNAALQRIDRLNSEAGRFDAELIAAAADQTLAQYDELQGGFGSAPKFPREPLLFLLLDRAGRDDRSPARAPLLHTLDAIARGAIHDQIGGGFHRYTVDPDWRSPHFEKMLYNQAQLARLYTGAWWLTGDPALARIARRTLDYVLRELSDGDGGFHAATDADDPGGEGTFYAWRIDELDARLPAADAALVARAYCMSAHGDHAAGNLLHLCRPLATLAAELGTAPAALQERLDRIGEQLRVLRAGHPPPAVDTKVITAWNALVVTALAEAAVRFDDDRYRRAALAAGDALWRRARDADGRWSRVVLGAERTVAATLEDAAALAQAALALYDLSGERGWLERAAALADGLWEGYWDDAGQGFRPVTRPGPAPLALRLADPADGALASAVSLALAAHVGLARRDPAPHWRRRAHAILAAYGGTVARSPSDYAYFVTAAAELLEGTASDRGHAALGAIRAILRPAADGARVTLEIANGWHVNGPRPSRPELVATRIDATGDGAAPVAVDYPQAAIMRLGFSPEPLALYTGTVEIPLRLEPARDRSRALALRLGLQACNDRLCLPPETLVLRLPGWTLQATR